MRNTVVVIIVEPLLPVTAIKDTEQHITKVSGTQFRMSCADLLKDTKEGNL